MSKNLRALSARHTKDKTLFQALTDTLEADEGTLQTRLQALSDERLISPAALLGTASFYDFLYPQGEARRAYLCNGTSCRLSGKQGEVLDVLTRHHAPHEIGHAACLGHCYCGGGYWQEGHTYDAEHGPDTHARGIPFYCAVDESLFTGETGTLDDFYQPAFLPAEKVRDELFASRLRGRGGAGFGFADKLAACACTPDAQKYVVCNGDEGDPGAFSDRYLLEQAPHRVLLGMLVAGLAADADTGYVYVRAEYPEAIQAVAEAIAAFAQTETAARSGFHFALVRGAGSYICGEETALLNSIEGLRPEVRVRPPYPAQQGLFGKPTLLSNVETFAAVPWILQHGGAAFAALGTAESTGTKLVCLDAGFQRPGVHEVAMGTPLQTVIDELGGGFRRDTKAIQVGGPLGSIVPVQRIDELTLDFESFCEHGFQLGHAGIIAIPQDYPVIDLLRHLFEYMADESCGKCLPCRLGTEKGARLLQQASAEAPLDRALFEELLVTLELGSLCALGSGLPLPVRNVLQYFAAELREVMR
jgi:NADH-quinone oxidoreductase subunit F